MTDSCSFRDVANVVPAPGNARESAALRLAELAYEEGCKYVPGRLPWADLQDEAREYYVGLVDHWFFTSPEALPRGTIVTDEMIRCGVEVLVSYDPRFESEEDFVRRFCEGISSPRAGITA